MPQRKIKGAAVHDDLGDPSCRALKSVGGGRIRTPRSRGAETPAPRLMPSRRGRAYGSEAQSAFVGDANDRSMKKLEYWRGKAERSRESRRTGELRPRDPRYSFVLL
jgi:hypothetical protein